MVRLLLPMKDISPDVLIWVSVSNRQVSAKAIVISRNKTSICSAEEEKKSFAVVMPSRVSAGSQNHRIC